MSEVPEKLVTLMVKFACRTSPIEEKEVNPKALQAVLRQEWPDLFQTYIEKPSLPIPNVLFVMGKRYYVGNGMMDAASFVLTRDIVEIIMLRKMGRSVLKEAASDLWAEDSSVQGKVRSVLLKLASQFKDYAYHRTAQVFEMQFGPFEGEELNALRGSLVGRADSEIGEAKVLMTKYHEDGGRVYHYHCEAQYIQNDVMEPIMLNVKIDVNNRQMTDSLDPNDMTAIWKHGQSKRMELIHWLIGGEES